MIKIETKEWDPQPLQVATEFFVKALDIKDNFNLIVKSAFLPFMLGGTTYGDKKEIVVSLNGASHVPTVPTLEILAHEMIHVHQVVRGDLVLPTYAHPFLTWQKYPPISVDHAFLLARLGTAPWEQEAYGGQQQLYLRFLDFIRRQYVAS